MYDVTLGTGLECLEKSIEELVARLSTLDEFIFPSSDTPNAFPASQGGALGVLGASLYRLALAQSIMASIEAKVYRQEAQVPQQVPVPVPVPRPYR